ncbi:MAG: hypothetical protein JXR81_11625 [Candidatus Goldbacteria bacterium]|nr:hypothetical protein [Candidatus Goldiibacteriota bacterium]
MRRIIIILAIAVNTGMILLYNCYSLVLNRTNHYGFNTFEVIMPFMAGILVSIILLIIRYVKKMKYKFILEVVLIGISLMGVANVILFEKLNIMMPYDKWVGKGMIEKFDSKTP